MVNYTGIKSLLDLGCGRGISTSWFITHGLEYVVCAEGSHDAISQSLIPNITNIPNRTRWELVEHDFSRGPWWPSRTVDAAWCVEFTEHVGRNYQQNYYTAFRKAALIFVTHSNWGGWHHVEVHNDDWWRVKMEAAGFVYSDILTKEMRGKAGQDKLKRKELGLPKSDRPYSVAQHLWTTLQVGRFSLSAMRICIYAFTIQKMIVSYPIRCSSILWWLHCLVSLFLYKKEKYCISTLSLLLTMH